MTNIIATLLLATNYMYADVSGMASNRCGILLETGYMTTPVETVVVVTNVTTEIGKECPGCTRWIIQQGDIVLPGHDDNCPEKSLPPGIKRETINVVEIKTLRFEWDGEEQVIKRERVLSSKVKRWVRKEDWVEEPQ